MSIQAGDLNRRITIQNFTISQDGDGLAVKNWADWITVWAAIEPLTGRELIQAAAVMAEATTRIRIRYQAGVTSAMRVVYGTRIFDILSVIDIQELHQEIQFMCKEVTAGG